MSYQPPDLAPLMISPQMAAQARSNAAHPASAPPAEQAEQPVDQLKAMFPDYDKDVLESILATSDNNVETAITQLLEMSEAGSGGGGGGGGGGLLTGHLHRLAHLSLRVVLGLFVVVVVVVVIVVAIVVHLHLRLIVLLRRAGYD